MASSRDTKLHQSQEVGAIAGGWQLPPGRALSLYPRGEGLLRITRGRAWVTLDLRPGALVTKRATIACVPASSCACGADAMSCSSRWIRRPVVRMGAGTGQRAAAGDAADAAARQAWSEFWQAARLTLRALLRLLRGLLATLPWLLNNGFNLRRR